LDVYKAARATFSGDYLLDLDEDDPWEVQQATDSGAQGTPTPRDDINIKIFCEVSFSHTITHPANGKLVGSFLGTIINGRVDRGIESRLPPGRRGSMKRPKRCLQFLLLVIQAKS
jgi:hypothetical protein